MFITAMVFREGNVFTSVCLSVWGDSVGTPGPMSFQGVCMPGPRSLLDSDLSMSGGEHIPMWDLG